MTSTELPATPERLMVEPKPKRLTAVTYNDDASDLHEILFLALHGHNIICAKRYQKRRRAEEQRPRLDVTVIRARENDLTG
jgi:hypothetical protein